VWRVTTDGLIDRVVEMGLLVGVADDLFG